MTRNDYGDLSTLLISKLQVLENKVDALNQDRVTRTDFENLRKEISGSYVPRDAYEPRHAALVERDLQLESQIRELRKDCETDLKELRDSVQKDQQRIHDRLESGKQQIEDRLSLQQEQIEQDIKQQQEAQLSAKDRHWVRISQIGGIAAIIIALVDLALQILQHIKLQ
jgi:hypothetical protein